MRVIKWLWWNLWYLSRPHSSDLTKWMRRVERTRSPWWKFKPFLFYNEPGRQWEVFFSNESSHAQRKLIEVTVHIGENTGEIVGLNIQNRTLRSGGDWRSGVISEEA